MKTKNNNLKFFIKNNYRNLSLVIGLFLVVILLFILVTIVLQASNNISTLFYDNYKKGLQLIITGFNLGISSYIMQRITKNRLTDTTVMGFGSINLIPLVTLALMTNFQNSPNSNKPLNEYSFNMILPIIFIICSVLLTCAFHLFSKQQNKMNHSKLLISGIILNFICIAIALSLKNKLDYLAIDKIDKYITGFINSAVETQKLFFALGISLIAYLWLLLITPKLKVLIINQEIGLQVGINNSLTHLQTFIIIGLFVGSSYGLTGDFVFVGLLAGNIAFSIFKNNIGYGAIGSGFIGALLVLITFFIFDNCVNIKISIIPQLIPLLISPYFLFLLFRREKNAR